VSAILLLALGERLVYFIIVFLLPSIDYFTFCNLLTARGVRMANSWPLSKVDHGSTDSS
jgi:hypothetical protein